MKKQKILIADDHQIIVSGLKTMLLTEPLLEFVGSVSDASRIVSRLALHQADILILDINMGVVNTLPMILEIKEKFPDLKIMVFSHFESLKAKTEALKLGADVFLNKNTTKEQLIQTLVDLSNNEKGAYPSFAYLENMDDSSNNKESIEDKLTERELEVLIKVAEGNTSKEIATLFFISKHTVQWHRKNIIRKLNIHSTGGLIRFAYENKLV